jgi:rare lipoprotein A (peptidoglycan hydrolase)
MERYLPYPSPTRAVDLGACHQQEKRMLHFTRSLRQGSLVTLATLMLVIASLAGTATPAARADEAPVVVIDGTAGQEGSGDAGTFAWKTALASSYGPGLWGNRTACGQTLYTTTIGVAHRTMACGTRLKFLGKNGVVVAATVIDRGPYSGDRVFDLTQATVQKMGYSSSADFGVRNVSWDYN